MILSKNRCPKGLEPKATVPAICGDRDECWHLSCGSGGFCHNIDYGGGFYCDCPNAYDNTFKTCTNCTCDNLLIDSQSVLQISSRTIAVIMFICMLLIRTHLPQLILVFNQPLKFQRSILLTQSFPSQIQSCWSPCSSY